MKFSSMFYGTCIINVDNPELRLGGGGVNKRENLSLNCLVSPYFEPREKFKCTEHGRKTQNWNENFSLIAAPVHPV